MAEDEQHSGGNVFTRKMGPLPMWGWGLGAGAIAFLFFKLHGKGKAKAAPADQPLQNTAPTQVTIGGGGGYGGGGPTGPTGPTAPTGPTGPVSYGSAIIALATNDKTKSVLDGTYDWNVDANMGTNPTVEKALKHQIAQLKAAPNYADLVAAAGPIYGGMSKQVGDLQNELDNLIFWYGDVSGTP